MGTNIRRDPRHLKADGSVRSKKRRISAQCAGRKFYSMMITRELRDVAKAQADKATVSEAEAEAGMAEMSKRFHDEGGEIYLPAE